MRIPLTRAVLISVAVVAPSIAADGPPRPPATRVEVVTDRMHGIDIPDPYRWLEDQESPETREWIGAQNAYTRAVLDGVPGRERLRAQLEKVYRSDSQSAPIVRNGRYFFSRRSATQDQAALVVRDGPEGRERVLVDPQTLSPDLSVSANILSVTPDGRLLAWAKRKGGEDEAEILFLDVDTGQPLPDRIPPGVYYSAFVLPDKSGVLYSRRGADGTRLVQHRFGSRVDEDRELFGAGIPDDKLIWFQFSTDGRFVAAFVNDGGGGNGRSRLYLLDRSTTDGFRPIVADIAANFDGVFGGHTLFMRTTWNAPNRRVIAIDAENPARERWKDIIPTSPDSVMAGLTTAGHRLLVSYVRDVSTRLAIFEADGTLVSDVPLPTLGSAYFMSGTWESDEVFYRFESFAQPFTTYRYDLATSKQSVWYKQNVPVDSAAIVTTQVWFKSKDGTRVPMFVVDKKGAARDGNRPVLLSGYGGYGAVPTPFFYPTAAMWIDNGGVFAWASIRGGGEFGEKWHRDGMLDKKQNSFNDFIAAAEWLIANNYTTAAHLAIEGGSNGGMLVAAAAMQRPDLFQAVICRNPHLDMLRYHKFLKAAPWVHEYGNPDVPKEFAYLRKYSPYQQVRDGVRYPAMLFTTGDGDTRVAPLHARKMAARMQATTRSERPVLLRYDLIAGHMGSGALSHLLDQVTDELAFLYAQLGLSIGGTGSVSNRPRR